MLWQSLATHTLEGEICSDSAAEERYPLYTVTDAIAGLKNNVKLMKREIEISTLHKHCAVN